MRNLQDDQFKREKKMGQVIQNGSTDAMKGIQEARKEMIVLLNKERQYSQKIVFLAETEGQVDEHTENIKSKVKELEMKVRSIGLNPDREPEDIITSHIKDPMFTLIRRKLVEKESQTSMKKKYHAKFKDLKDELEVKLIQFNELTQIYPNNDLNPETLALNTDSHPLMTEIKSVLDELKPSMPLITSKLPMYSSFCFKPRSTNGSLRYPYINKSVEKMNKLDSKSVNDLHISKPSTTENLKIKVDSLRK